MRRTQCTDTPPEEYAPPDCSQHQEGPPQKESKGSSWSPEDHSVSRPPPVLSQEGISGAVSSRWGEGGVRHGQQLRHPNPSGRVQESALTTWAMNHLTQQLHSHAPIASVPSCCRPWLGAQGGTPSFTSPGSGAESSQETPLDMHGLCGPCQGRDTGPRTGELAPAAPP